MEDAIWREIGQIQDEGVTTAELEKAIKQTKAQFVYSSESVTYQAYWLGFSEVVADTDWLDNWVERSPFSGKCGWPPVSSAAALR